MASQTAEKTDTGLAARLAALASLGAAVIHFAVAPTHWQEWMHSGLFFVVIALFQLIWAKAVLTRPTTTVLAAGIVGNVGIVALWAVSRTAGPPFGPHAGVPELVQSADLCTLLLEIYIVMAAGWMWYRGRRSELIPGFANAFILIGFSAVISLAATVGAMSGLQHDHHAPAGTESDHHPSVGQGHHEHAESATLPPRPSADRPATPPPAQIAPPTVDPTHETAGDHHHHE